MPADNDTAFSYVARHCTSFGYIFNSFVHLIHKLHQKPWPNHLLQKHSHFQRQATRITHQQHQCQGAGHYLGTAAGAAHIRPKHTQKPEQDTFPPCSYTRLTAHTQFAAYTWSDCRQPKNAKTCFCILCHASMPTMSTPPQPNY
jgi:hypothetical protein